MSNQENTPKMLSVPKKATSNILREKQLNTHSSTLSSSSQLKTPVSHVSKFIKKQSQTAAITSKTKSKDEENLTQSAKTRQLLSRLKATNAAINSKHLSQISSSKESITPTHSAHRSSHQNLSTFMNTPKRQTLLAAASINSGSAKREPNSAKKSTLLSKPQISTSAQLSNSGKSQRIRPFASVTQPTTTTTPSYRPSSKPMFTSNSASKASQDSSELHPIINGVDYSEIIARKPELGYGGPGYIVEFNCEEKYLRGLTVKKGFWRINATEAPSNTPLANLGPSIFMSQVYSDNDKKTPSKALTLFDFDYNRKPHYNTVAKSYNIDDTSTTHGSLSLQTKSKCKAKKSIRWADNLEPINENTSISSSSPAISGSIKKSQNDSNASSNQTPIGTSSSMANASSLTRRSLRRSLSMGDMNDLILESENDHSNSNRQTANTNETFELISTSTNESKTVNDTFDLNRLMALTSLVNDNDSHAVKNATFDLEKPTTLNSLGTNAPTLSPCYCSSQTHTPSFSYENPNAKCLSGHVNGTQLNVDFMESLTISINVTPNRSSSEDLITKANPIAAKSAEIANSTQLDENQFSLRMPADSHAMKSSDSSSANSCAHHSPMYATTNHQIPTKLTTKYIDDSIEHLEHFLKSLARKSEFTKQTTTASSSPSKNDLDLSSIANMSLSLTEKRFKFEADTSAEFMRIFNLLDKTETYVKYLKKNITLK